MGKTKWKTNFFLLSTDCIREGKPRIRTTEYWLLSRGYGNPTTFYFLLNVFGRGNRESGLLSTDYWAKVMETRLLSTFYWPYSRGETENPDYWVLTTEPRLWKSTREKGPVFSTESGVLSVNRRSCEWKNVQNYDQMPKIRVWWWRPIPLFSKIRRISPINHPALSTRVQCSTVVTHPTVQCWESRSLSVFHQLFCETAA
jgi:hypothetical protein